MSITSFYFLCFYAITLGVYYIVPKKQQWVILLISSVAFFVLSGNPILIVYPLLVGSVCYISVVLMGKKPSIKKSIVSTSLLISLGIIVVLKYSNFGIYTFNALLGSIINVNVNALNFLVPIGISFYTFSMIGYVIDVYNGIEKIQKNYFKFLLYGMYFPIMISGPLLRYREDGEQFFEPHSFNYQDITFGMQRILWGFFKKLVISERLAIVVSTVYSQYTSYSGLYIVVATICFSLQLYTDFSGCMDIVLGLSQTFGITLPENFNTPFFSKSISEYWRRWHITLGVWMKDYVFYPLLRTKMFTDLASWSKEKYGKKKGKRVPVYLAMVVLWFTVGMWHGGAWKYIVGSGLLHCMYIVGGELLEPLFIQIKRKLRIKEESRWFNLFRQCRTFTLVCIGFVFFRANSFFEGLDIMQFVFRTSSLSFVSEKGTILGLDVIECIIAIIGVMAVWGVGMLQKGQSIRERVAAKRLPVRWIIYYTLLFCVILWGYYGPGYSAAEFIYQGF